MDERYSYDLIGGRRLSALVVAEDCVLSGTRRGLVCVEAGLFTLAGTLQGSLNIHGGAVAHIVGRQQGSVFVAKGGRVTVNGAIEGSLRIERGAIVVIEDGGKLAGSLSNDGSIVVRGVFGGSQSGTGTFELQGSGRIKEPILRDGMHFYKW